MDEEYRTKFTKRQFREGPHSGGGLVKMNKLVLLGMASVQGNLNDFCLRNSSSQATCLSLV